ncbi:xylose isomerase [Acrocarpospora phusangensis]|uniref:Xylose isomerase n=1 Tax=Acrocarpospora phusangensis TaxID=1070424 RepID=A0A919QDS5_9ACTN|nr:sugar phosphate isomerase/epimerase family protein [Acrocarpospora phusangensis]GIH26873.1 xylose isomerase [Acrocarpospora phusangensis]
MKLAVSTLGLPGEGVAAAVETAVRGGCDGLELRLHPDTGVHAGLDAAGRAAVRDTIHGHGLAVAALAGYTKIAAPGPDEPVAAGLRADLELAADLGATGVRVFPGGDDLAAAARRVRAVADLCREHGVRVFVETHDSLPTGAAVAGLLDAVALPDVTGAIWDLLHPWRHGEPPATTLAALARHLAYVQIKDAVSAADTTPRPLGAGSVPLDACGELLRGFPGWVSLEWERTWYPHVEPVAEILPGARDWVSRYAISSA